MSCGTEKDCLVTAGAFDFDHDSVRVVPPSHKWSDRFLMALQLCCHVNTSHPQVFGKPSV